MPAGWILHVCGGPGYAYADENSDSIISGSLLLRRDTHVA